MCVYSECVFGQFWNSSRKSTNFWFAGLKTIFWNLCFAVANDWFFTFFLQKTARVSPRTLRIGLLGFWKSAGHLLSGEIASSWFCFLQSDDSEFWGSFEKFFKLFAFPVKRGQCCGWWFRQLGKSVSFAVKICKFVALWQLLWAKKLVCLNPRKCVPTEELQLTRRARFLFFAGRWSWGPEGNFFPNACHHVVIVIWAKNFVCSESERRLLQDDDHCFSRPQLFPGLYQVRFGMTAERIRISLDLAGSKETRRVGIERLKCNSPSYWPPWTAFLLLYPQFRHRLERKDALVIWEHSRFVLSCP